MASQWLLAPGIHSSKSGIKNSTFLLLFFFNNMWVIVRQIIQEKRENTLHTLVCASVYKDYDRLLASVYSVRCIDMFALNLLFVGYYFFFPPLLYMYF